MAKTTSKFRVIKDSSIYNNTKCASYGDDVLMVDVRGGIYLGNETSTPDLIAISNKQLKTINGESISGNGNIAIDANIMAIDISGDIDNVEEITTTQSDWNETNQSSPAYIKNKPVIPSEITESTISGWGFTKNTGTYSKPSTGIPKSDLASTVQTSLDNAIQAPLTTTEDLGELPTIQTPINVAGGLFVTNMALFSQGTISASYNFDLEKSITTNGDKLVFKTDLTSESVAHEVVFVEDLEGKQDIISDLDTIRSGAAKGATALQSYTEQYKGTITGVSANGTSVATSGVANIPAATTSGYGVTKLSSATNSTSTTLAATASAVKVAYDLANSYKGTVTAVKVNGTSYSPVSGVVDLGTLSGGSSSSGGTSAYPIIRHEITDITINANTYNIIKDSSNRCDGEIIIEFGYPINDVVNEYIIQFTCGSDTTLTLPSNIYFANNTPPPLTTGNTYVITIINNLAKYEEYVNYIYASEFYVKDNTTGIIYGPFEFSENEEYSLNNLPDGIVGCTGGEFGINIDGWNYSFCSIDEKFENKIYTVTSSSGGSGGEPASLEL